jgi:2-methylisocitrate lyase-like PEP mutase family enzyme
MSRHPETTAKAAILTSLHCPGEPLIVVNVWDSITARIVAAVPGVAAIATASHAISEAHGVPDNEGLTLKQALRAASLIIDATEHPVSVDFEKGYAADAAGVEHNVTRLVEAGAAGINLEDSLHAASGPLRDPAEAAERIAAARRAADALEVPLAINARVDALAGDPTAWDDAVDRGKRYLDAGATSVFMLGLRDETSIERAVAQVPGPIAVIAGPGMPHLQLLAELGVARVSFGPRIMGLTLSHLQRAARQLTELGGYPEGLDFEF